MERYDIAAVSPVAYDVDEERPVLEPYTGAYDKYPPNEDGLMEATVALGPCLAMNRADVDEVLSFLTWDLPYRQSRIF